MSDYLCLDCKDTGVYRGLNTVEPCRTCGGKKDTGLSLFGKPIVEVPGMEAGPDIAFGPLHYIVQTITKETVLAYHAMEAIGHATYAYGEQVGGLVVTSISATQDEDNPMVWFIEYGFRDA